MNYAVLHLQSQGQDKHVFTDPELKAAKAYLTQLGFQDVRDVGFRVGGRYPADAIPADVQTKLQQSNYSWTPSDETGYRQLGF